MKVTPRKYAQALALMLDTAEKTIISNFLTILRQRKQSKMLPKILQALEEEWYKKRGIRVVTVSYPPKFESSLPELEMKLKEKLGEKIRLKKIPIENLIGGFTLKVDDTLIDASVSGGLRELTQRLTK